ncbi:hypothetical protein DSCO28_48400 [Desulfosarcina ovata subsp. sediminis]|uniref:Uncharacterized protein n=1 Tax=Desulfosarcina ovata subsp. sediminis TaxID=885957 RepID=A0A5K7ZVS1_9BACT|nr:hypothetical protein [Desulfosarcina ovata]BBO84274.1 hypothetical protein DSCO28_48400 [Desulfosarcina ovata subsp. sediminis]
MGTVANLRQPLLVIFAIVCAILMFFGGADLVHMRSFKRAWDLGHIAAFAVWSLLLLRGWRRLATMGVVTQVVVVVLLTTGVGGAVEIAQGAVGRYPGWADVEHDILGSLLAIFFLFPSRLQLHLGWRRMVQVAILGWLLLALAPVARALVDEWDMTRAFPVLADFEAPFELERWSGNAHLSIDHSIAVSGRASLCIDLNTTRYSGASLNYFPGDWRGWQWIAFSVYNPDPQPIRLVCKINDHQHDISGCRYADRFNRTFEMHSGWNRIRIPLEAVATAPQGRRMDLSRISEFNLFAVELPQSRQIFLDWLALES